MCVVLFEKDELNQKKIFKPAKGTLVLNGKKLVLLKFIVVRVLCWQKGA